MLPDAFQMAQTRARFDATATARERNERLIRQGRLLQVDTPDRVQKFLDRRGIVRSPSGFELTGIRQTDALELTGGASGEVLERIIGTSDLMGIAFLERGMQVARSVARIWVDASGGQAAAYGTGFLVSPRLLLTNHHVLGDPGIAARSLAQFDYALQASGQPYPTAIFRIDAQTFHLADRHLDFALVAVAPTSQEGRALSQFGWNKLSQEEGKAIAAQYGNIVQHPNAEFKQLTLRENRIVAVLPEFLHYTADTEGGSSGSPVYNDRWEVVALHHSGVPKTDGAGRTLAVDGSVWRQDMGEARIQWIYNEGVRVSSLMAFMRDQAVEPAMRELLAQALDGAAPATAPTAVPTPPGTAATTEQAPGSSHLARRDGPATWTIPITVSIDIAGLTPAGPSSPTYAPPPPAAASMMMDAPPALNTKVPMADDATLAAARAALKGPDVLGVRWGFKFRDGQITKERALVVTVLERKSILALQSAGMSPLPAAFMGFPVEVTTPTAAELVANDHGPAGQELFGRISDIAQEITYTPPDNAPLNQVTDVMRVHAHVSPDLGWPTLKNFLGGTQTRLVVGMYDFGAPHIVAAIEDMGRKKAFKKMTLTMREHGSLDDPNGTGVKAKDYDNADAAEEIGGILKGKFECAFVTLGSVNGWVAKAYHIKVAVRDEKAFWLSSGNWQSSNQPDIAPLNDQPQTISALRTYNREWHVIIEHSGLSATLQKYLLHDFENNPPSTAEAIMPALPDVFVPIDAQGLEAAAQFQYFAPLDANRQFKVTPLLTPDAFVKPVVELLRSAKSEILIQNQTFNAPYEGDDALASLIDAIIDKQQQGVSVRVIIRSFHAADDRSNLEALTARGLKIGTVRFQKNSHTKGVIVDRAKVLVGSQNWSQTGVTTNRDASLLFEDKEIAEYFANIYDHDWKVLAKPTISSEARGARVAGANEATPAGYVRLNAAELLFPS